MRCDHRRIERIGLLWVSITLAFGCPGCTSDGNTPSEPADQLTMDDTPMAKSDGTFTGEALGDAMALHAGPGDTGGRDMVLTRDLSIVDGSLPDLTLSEARYDPDDGPIAEHGEMVSVDSEADILQAIVNAEPGHIITVQPGTYSFSQLITVRADGTPVEPIFLRADARGTVIFNLSHIENFKVYGKHWVFENLRIVGDCENNEGCEHAFHIVGDADDLYFRHNDVVNFASHVKLNAGYR